MPRLVVLYFEDNEEAQNFVGCVQGGHPDVVGEVTAVFALPTKFCECPHRVTEGRYKYICRQGAKYGWWVHAESHDGKTVTPGCGKPSGLSSQSPHNLLTPPSEISTVNIHWSIWPPVNVPYPRRRS